MAKVTATDIRRHLIALGLDANPVERITINDDGSATVYLTSISHPIDIPAPSPPRKRKKPA